MKLALRRQHGGQAGLPSFEQDQRRLRTDCSMLVRCNPRTDQASHSVNGRRNRLSRPALVYSQGAATPRRPTTAAPRLPLNATLCMLWRYPFMDSQAFGLKKLIAGTLLAAAIGCMTGALLRPEFAETMPGPQLIVTQTPD